MLMNKDNKVLNVPHLRFPEFTKELKNTSLGKIGKTFNGLTGKSGSDFGQGFPYITYKSIFDNSKIDISRVEYVEITDIERKKETQNKVQYGDVFFTTSSETPDEVGMSSVLLDEIKDCYLNSFCFGYRLNSLSKTVPEYMRFYLRSQTIRKKMFVLAQGSTRFNISKSEVMGMSINIPEIEEQRKIANLLTLLDERLVTQNKIIEDLKKLKSAIRKKVFVSLKEEHTESCEINQLLTYEQPTAYIVINDEYSTDTTLIPVLTANKGFVLGYTDENFGIYQKGECIIFDDFTMDAKYVSFPFKVKSSAIKILAAKPNVNLRFMFEYLSYLELKSEEHKRHYISEIASLVVELPSKEMQNQIASLMTLLDNKLALEEKANVRYENEKQYLLSQMFI